MGVESPDTIYDLNRNWPEGPVDSRREGDDHLRNLKGALLDTFLVDEIANRPAAGTENRLFISTDERKFYRDTGTAWEEIPDLSGYALASDLTAVEDDLDALANSHASRYRSTDQSMSSTVWTRVNLNGEDYDVGSNNFINYRYVAPAAGKYLVTAAARCRTRDSGDDSYVGIYKNGSLAKLIGRSEHKSTVEGTSHAGAAILDLNASDYVELWANVEGGLGVNGDAGGDFTWMQVARLA